MKNLFKTLWLIAFTLNIIAIPGNISHYTTIGDKGSLFFVIASTCVIVVLVIWFFSNKFEVK